MLAWLEQFLVRYPELALFLVIAVGYWIGSFKVGAFSLGPVTGSLFAGLVVGGFQSGIDGLSSWLMRIIKEVGHGAALQAVRERRAR
jgi:uncharacterized transporter YbjL